MGKHPDINGIMKKKKKKSENCPCFKIRFFCSPHVRSKKTKKKQKKKPTPLSVLNTDDIYILLS